MSAYSDSSNSQNIDYTPETTIWLWYHTPIPMPQIEIQWFFILVAVVIVLFLTGMVTLIMLRSLYKGMARYNQEEVISGDDLQPRRKGVLLSIFLVIISMVTLAFACFAFLVGESPEPFIICSVGLFVCLLTPAGFVLAGINGSFSVQKWKSKVILASIVCPGIIFLLFFAINDLLLASSAMVPLSTLIALLVLWLGVCVPWTFVGTYFVICRRIMEHPVRTNIIPRQQIPDQTVDTQPAVLSVGNVLYPKIDELW